jgi:hypothetical protein
MWKSKMKRFWLFSILLITIVITLAFISQPTIQALPEYAAQTGEPCASCHVSPSGGGPRTLRGQAWIAAQKPGAVPDVAESLELLGVHLDIDESTYTTVPESIPSAAPLAIETTRTEPIHNWLKDYDGN